MLERAEASLRRGDVAGALDAFERAAGMQHSAEIEMGIVRAQMQLGEYRRALAFCAHVAGAHTEVPASAALYAWLLRLGGQEAIARRVLAEALARSPGDATLAAAARAFAAPLPRPAGVLLEPPQRMAPWPSGAGDVASPTDGRVISSGVLVAATKAVVPAGVLASGGAGEISIRVRNGLGQSTRAVVDGAVQTPLDPRLVALRLLDPLDADAIEAPAAREPFAGSPGYVVEYAATPDAAAAWPWLRQGFVGGAIGGSALRQLGIDVADGPHGGPVLDASGRLAGIALRDPASGSVWLPAARWHLDRVDHDVAPAANGQVRDVPRTVLIGADVVYERALRVALQVIAAR